MEYYDERSRLFLEIRDDLRQRDLNAWNAALREWREAHGVMAVPLGKLSNNEYNCGVLYAALKAGWITASGRKTADPEQATRLVLTDVDTLPAPEALDDWTPGLVQWYGERVQLTYASLFAISPN